MMRRYEKEAFINQLIEAVTEYCKARHETTVCTASLVKTLRAHRRTIAAAFRILESRGLGSVRVEKYSESRYLCHTIYHTTTTLFTVNTLTWPGYVEDEWLAPIDIAARDRAMQAVLKEAKDAGVAVPPMRVVWTSRYTHNCEVHGSKGILWSGDGSDEWTPRVNAVRQLIAAAH